MAHEYGTFGSPSRESPRRRSPRFPFHPESVSTPWWRKAMFRLFDGARGSSDFQDIDLWPLPDGLRSEQTAAEMRRRLAASSRGVRGVVRSMVAELARQPRMVALVLARLLCVVADPLLVFRLFQLAAETPRRGAEICAVLLALHAAYLGTALLLCHCDYLLTKVNMRLTSGLRALLLEGVLRRGLYRTNAAVSAAADGSGRHRKQRIAELTNTYSGDVNCVMSNVSGVVLHWDIPLLLAVELYALSMAVQCHWGMLMALVGAVSMTVVVGSTVEQAMVRRAAALRTVYVNVIHECLKGIQMVKLCAWEDKMRAKIFSSRAVGARSRQHLTLLHLLRRAVAQELPSLLLVVTLTWMTRSHSEISPSTVFTSFYFFRKVRLRVEELHTHASLMRGFADLSSWMCDFVFDKASW
ncbi:hypothetical protein P43SY_011535 [Pythium insidiosum]|uniref:ABC transmembrane type-1 domain-containing protein n=1 Tax=Pythium insidiosum TaxID=114742 RepID=A0AAD5LSA1_PYTIN|nr:hypothetical protein P43SY_011535 [Pythium insidiosum]